MKDREGLGRGMKEGCRRWEGMERKRNGMDVK
jgi:hypothetical protein